MLSASQVIHRGGVAVDKAHRPVGQGSVASSGVEPALLPSRHWRRLTSPFSRATLTVTWQCDTVARTRLVALLAEQARKPVTG